MVGPQHILEFWLDQVGPQGWHATDDALDAQIRERFEDTLKGAAEGRFSLWLTHPTGALAYIILTDQFPRNMYRGSARSFASDGVALAVAKSAIDKGWDLKIDGPGRQFFYVPLMHSENLCDQERCVRLMCERMADKGAGMLLHARAHREIIRQFGRFPYRNQALARATSPSERAYVEGGGYGATLRELQKHAA